MEYWQGKAARELIATYLDKFIRPYTEDFDIDKLYFKNVMEGVVTFRNLRIKKGALDKFRLPVEIIEGHLGRLDMKIPLFYLGSRPVEVTIEDLYLLVVPTSESKVDLEEDERRAQAAKQERLSDAELMESRSKLDLPSSEDDPRPKVVNDSITNKVINNLKITIRNVHIRYEDKMSVPGHPFAAGITLRVFNAQTTDGEWQPAFVQSSVGAIHKLGKLESLALYFNTDAESISGLQIDESIETFRSLIATDSHVPKHQYILSPVSGEFRLIIHHKIGHQTPRLDVQILFDELGFLIDDRQYRAAISMIDMYYFYVRQAPYRKYRPSEERLKDNRARVLIRFAGDSILREIHEKKRRWTWDYFRDRRDDRHKYIDLFKRKLDGHALGVTEADSLKALEVKLSYEDIHFYRSIAKYELKKHRATRKHTEIQIQQEQSTSGQEMGAGWPSWPWGGGAPKSTDYSEDPEASLTEDQLNDIFRAIGYDQKQTSDTMRVRASAGLKKGWLSLRKRPHLNHGEGVEITSVVFEDVRVEVLQLAESLETVLTLGALTVFDGTSSGTLYHRIVRVKDEAQTFSQLDSKRMERAAFDNRADEATKEPQDKVAIDGLLYIKFEQNSMDQRVDNVLTIRMNAMEMIYHRGYIEAIYDFLRPLESQMESVNSLLDAATETLGKLQDRTKAGLEHALQTHQTVDVKVDIASPIIIVPESVRTTQCLHIILDAGHISMRSDPPAANSSESMDFNVQSIPPVNTAKAYSEIFNVHITMTNIRIILMDESRRLATLSLSAADVAIFVRGNTLRVEAKLGNLSVSEDSPMVSAHPSFKSIISTEGDELADFSYETFDPEDKETFPGVNSAVYLRIGSLKATFLEEPLHDIYSLLIKFARLKSLYDQATQAAVQRASGTQRMKFDIQVKSPILLLPSNASNSQDLLVMKLGEIQASNSYSGPVSTIKAGLHGIRLTSRIMHNNELCKLKIIEHVEIDAEVIQTSDIDRDNELLKPDSEVKVRMSDVKIALTQAQYVALLNLLKAIPRALASADDANDAVQIAESQVASSRRTSKSSTPQPTVDLGPELGLTAHDKSGEGMPRWNIVDVVFVVNAIRLQLFDARATDETSLKECGIVRFSLNDNSFRFKVLSDGATQTEIILKSITINNTGSGGSRFREIIPAAQHSRNQFVVLFTTVGGSQVSSSVVVSVDSPKVICSIDLAYALLDFLTSGLPSRPPTGRNAEPEEPQTGGPQMSTRVEVRGISVRVLESDCDPNSHAIQLNIRDILMSHQGILSVTVNRLGMSLIAMNKPDECVSFLDDVDVTLSLDNDQFSGQQITNIELNTQPIVFRASYREINLFTRIVNKAPELLARRSSSTFENVEPSGSRARSLPSSSPNKGKGTTANKSQRSPPASAKVIVSKQRLKASFDGLRLVLIHDQLELPLLHLKTEPFTVSVSDWTDELRAYTTFHTYIAHWNLINSHWEPLINPWTFAVSVSKDSPSGALTTIVSSQEKLDINFATTFMETALTTMKVWSKEGDKLPKTGLKGVAPYRIVNQTGTLIHVWSEVGEKVTNPSQTAKLSSGESTEWRFDDWRMMQECVASGHNNSIAVRFEGKSWEQVHNIPVDREGEFVYALRPQMDKVADRLLCEVILKDSIKVVILRSTYKVENHTLFPIDLMLVDAKGKPTHPVQKLSPGQYYSLPIDAVLNHDIQLRPDSGFGYSWLGKGIKWENLIRSPSMTIECPPSFRQRNDGDPFHFQAWATYDQRDLINETYPQILLHLHAPVELENLLPDDIKYCFYDRYREKYWRGFLRKGGLIPIHYFHLDQSVLFNLEVQSSVFKPSTFALVNTDYSSDVSVEDNITLSDQDNRTLDLRINYYKHEDAGGAFRLQVYSPFIAINKTGLSIQLRAARGKLVAGQAKSNPLTPFMFSHPHEQGTDAEFVARFGDSQWSRALNFNTPSADTAVSLQSTSPNGKETHVGVSWAAGLGKYKLSKVITFAPRFLLRNELEQELAFREMDDPPSGALPLKPNTEVPIHTFQPGRDPSLSFRYPGASAEWSAPINLQSIGVIHVRLSKEGQTKPDLARVEVSISVSTIWVVFKKETGAWPFSIENQSDYIVTFAQIDDRPTNPGITYTVQPHDATHYSWDAPAAGEKKLSLSIDGQNRIIDIMEIGELMPFKFQTNRGFGVVSLKVRADGPTQILCISNYVGSLYKRRLGFTSDFVTEEITPSLSIVIDFEGIGISLVNRRMAEVVYFTLSKFKLEYTDSKAAQAVNLACGQVQIENRLEQAIYPVVLQRTALPRGNNGIDVPPAIQSSMIVLKDQPHEALFVKYFAMLLQAFTVRVDEDFLFALLDLTKVNAVIQEEKKEVDVLTKYPVTLPHQPIQGSRAIYFEVLELHPIQLVLSFMRTQRVFADERFTLRNPLTVVLSPFTMIVGDISDAPLQLNALAIMDILMTVPALQERIIYHYQQELNRQRYRVPGLTNFIENLIGLFTNVSSGAADEPSKRVLMHGSKEPGTRTAKGTANFSRETTVGVTKNMSKFIGRIGKGYQQKTGGRHKMSNSRHPVGIEGVEMQPIERAESGDAVNFFKNTDKGLVGPIAEPTVGDFEPEANFTEGIRSNTIFDDDQRKRNRIQRLKDGILTLHSQREAVSQGWMKDLENGKYRSERYVAHLALPGGDSVLMLTNSRVLEFLSISLRLRWDMPFRHLERVMILDTGIRFADKAGKEYDKFITIPDSKGKSWFFQEIEKVIKQWNADRRVER